MILVGISGTIGSGKTTLAAFLAESVQAHGHWESWQIIAEVANGLRGSGLAHPDPEDFQAINHWLEPLPELLAQTVHRTVAFNDIQLTAQRIGAAPEHYQKLFEYLHLIAAQRRYIGETITESLKEQFRSLLQWLGGYLAKTVSGDIWYAEIIRRILAAPDLDLATVGGVRFPTDAAVLQAAGGTVIVISRPSLASRDATDVTEREVSSVPADIRVINDGSLLQLQACAQIVLRDIKNKRPQPYYIASTHTKH